MQQVTIRYEKEPPQDELDILIDGIYAEANKKRGLRKFENFCFFLNNEQKSIIGGIQGNTYYGCMYIDILWIDEGYRGKGYGGSLIDIAEKLARERNCTFITLNTMDFEAKEFYEKLGYKLEFERHGYQANSIRYFFRKDIG